MSLLLVGSIYLALSLLCTLVLYCTCVIAGRSRRSPCRPLDSYWQANGHAANAVMRRLNVRSDLVFRL